MGISAHQHRHAHQQEGRTDPTRTKTARRRFAQHLRGRWDAIKYHINTGVVENDAFGFDGPDIGGGFAAQVDKEDDLTPGVRQFDFPSDADAAEAFQDWLDEAVDREILEKYDGDRYIRTGYGRGLKHADSRLREQGVDIPDETLRQVFALPIHRDKLALLHNRAFEELRGVTDATAQQIRRELTDGLAQGENPRKIARRMNKRIEAIGKTRSTVVARTEIVRAHSESTLTRYEQMIGPDAEVTIKAEWSTAANPCELCLPLAGQVFTIEEARGRLPRHPNCRCAWLPSVS